MLAALLFVGCGGGTDSTPAASPTTPAPAPAPPPPPPEDLVVPAAEAGKVAPDRIALTLTSEAETPLPDTAYQWITDEHSGWVFPAEGRTDDEGRIDATWIPGLPGVGELTLEFEEAGEERTFEFQTFSVAPPAPPWAQVVLRLNQPWVATGYSIDMTPLADPAGTYYVATGWSPAGYAGLQRGGTLFDHQLQFSMWDAEDGEAEVVETADGTVCRRFDHEGHGVQCSAEYPWSVGPTYRFEITEVLSDGNSLVSLRVTDLATGDERYIGTLSRPGSMGDTGLYTFNEDFRRDAPTCLDQQVRAVAFRRAMVRTNAMEWVPVGSGTPYPEEDSENPGTPACANFAVEPGPDGLELVMGGTTISDPHGTRFFVIPEGG